MDPFKTSRPKQDADAELIGLQAVAYIGADDELLMQFLGLSGSDIEDLQARISDPAFLGAALDFILSDDAVVVAFAESLGLPPDAPMRARHKLP